MSGFGENDFPAKHDTLELPFIWVPEDHTGPVPGHPWFEVGWMSFAEEASGMPQPSQSSDQHNNGGVGAAVPVGRNPEWASQPAVDTADMAKAAGLTRPAGEAPSGEAVVPPVSYRDHAAQAVSAAMQALETLARPDLGTSLLDDASQRAAVAKFASQPRIE